MNLKSAARTLGVHYQTAYRWVRSGELPAVRHGDGYEISDQAIELFVARRDGRRRLGQPGAHEMQPAALGQRRWCLDTLIAECEAMIRAGADTPMPALTHLLSGLATELDVLAVLHVLDGQDPPDVTARRWWHPDVEHNALWTRVLVRPDVTPVSCLAPVLQTGKTIAVDHLSIDQTQSFIPADLAYLLDTIYPHCVLMVPANGPDGVVAVLSLIIDRPGRVFTPEERAGAERAAATAAAAVVCAGDFARADRLRNELHAQLTEALASSPDREAAMTVARAAVAGTAGPACILGAGGEFLSASPAFFAIMGVDREAIAKARIADYSRSEDDERDRLMMRRVWSGELDHLCLRRTRLTPGGPVEVDGHCSLVRWPDGEPAVLVATQTLVPDLRAAGLVDASPGASVAGSPS